MVIGGTSFVDIQIKLNSYVSVLAPHCHMQHILYLGLQIAQLCCVNDLLVQILNSCLLLRYLSPSLRRRQRLRGRRIHRMAPLTVC